MGFFFYIISVENMNVSIRKSLNSLGFILSASWRTSWKFVQLLNYFPQKKISQHHAAAAAANDRGNVTGDQGL